jgi:uncharacterized membrane-anchored protein
MIESHERVEEFKQEIADMKVRDPATSRDRIWLRIGAGLLVVGLLVTIAAYFMSHNTTNALTQRDAITIGLIGIAATVVGAALFLRFWLARLSYEQQAQTDRVVEELGRR